MEEPQQPTPEDLIERLEEKCQVLLQRYRLLEEGYQKVKNERDQLAQENKAQKEQIRDFQIRLKNSRLVAELNLSEQESRALKNKIDQYLREIDRCIAHLGD